MKKLTKMLTNEQRELASKLYADAIKTADIFFNTHREICNKKHITQDDLASVNSYRNSTMRKVIFLLTYTNLSVAICLTTPKGKSLTITSTSILRLAIMTSSTKSRK